MEPPTQVAQCVNQLGQVHSAAGGGGGGVGGNGLSLAPAPPIRHGEECSGP